MKPEQSIIDLIAEMMFEVVVTEVAKKQTENETLVLNTDSDTGLLPHGAQFHVRTGEDNCDGKQDSRSTIAKVQANA